MYGETCRNLWREMMLCKMKIQRRNFNRKGFCMIHAEVYEKSIPSNLVGLKLKETSIPSNGKHWIFDILKVFFHPTSIEIIHNSQSEMAFRVADGEHCLKIVWNKVKLRYKISIVCHLSVSVRLFSFISKPSKGNNITRSFQLWKMLEKMLRKMSENGKVLTALQFSVGRSNEERYFSVALGEWNVGSERSEGEGEGKERVRNGIDYIFYMLTRWG